MKQSFLILTFLTAGNVLADDYQPRNTQPGTAVPPPAAEVAATVKLPAGFNATLFAGEPEVRQPIDMKVDDRGRLWVCESYSYKEWKHTGDDRVLILEDSDHDGKMDKRTVFRTGFHHLSSVEIGIGGIWVLDAPNLWFFPDKNRDDVPDSEPQIVLDGWTTAGGHNLASGLQMGHDGWLYGRHGILEPSMVGKPGTPAEKRSPQQPGIWRFHPESGKFETVVDGMTNPWGMDWNSEYEMFISGNVNGHLWHGQAGSLFERMYGSGSSPHDYERMKNIAERPHYESIGDWRQDWMKAEKGRDAKNDLGGGHSHCGLMVYQGNNWPAEYRDQLYLCNTHGRRINQETLVENGASYTSKHVADPFQFQTTWFRGVSLCTGPDGSVYVSDWCDDGECHDDDGVHRTSGRIYRIAYGQPVWPELANRLATATTEELLATATTDNEFFFRRAVRILRERGANPTAKLDFSTLKTPQHIIRGIWLAEAMQRKDLIPQSLGQHASASVVNQARIVLGQPAEIPADSHPRIWAHRAAALRMGAVTPALAGWKALLENPALEKDARLTLLSWHNLEPVLVELGPEVLTDTTAAKLQRFAARRLTLSPKFEALIEHAVGLHAASAQAAILAGMAEALNGRSQIKAPANWGKLRDAWQKNNPELVAQVALSLGDSSVATQFLATVNNAAASAAERSIALRSLGMARAAQAPDAIRVALKDKALRLAGLPFATQLAGDEAQASIRQLWPELSAAERIAAIDCLVSRPAWAATLLEDVGSGKVDRTAISLGQARQISLLKNPAANELLEKHWGKLAASRKDQEETMLKYRTMLTSGAKGDPEKGKAVFTSSCSACHQLFGEGGKFGPDLTGSGRKDLEYLLLNIINPNAVVPRDYQMFVVTLKDGQILSGVVPHEDATTLTLQSVSGKQILARDQIVTAERQSLSWMPEGLFQQLSEEQVRDLVAYLQK